MKFDETGEIQDLWKKMTKLALFDQGKMTLLVAKSGGDLEKALSHKFNHATF